MSTALLERAPTLTYAEFCAGYGGLGLAVEEVFGAELKWYSEFDAAPSKIMAHHWPGVPNHGDMTAIDWNAVEHVDILSGGTPCQDLSAAGRRKGMTKGTRSNLWVHMREAIAVIKPTYVVWENVRGAYSASADSDLEQCPGCVGDPGDGRVFLRALGRVLGDLSDLGYDCQWRGLRAADVGGCHGRYRVFILATYRDGAGRIEHGRAEPVRTEHATAECAGDDARNPDSGTRGGSAELGSAGWGASEIQDAAADTRGEAGEQWPRPRESGARVGRERFADDGGDPPHADAESLGRGEGWAESARLERGSDNALSGCASFAHPEGWGWRVRERDDLGPAGGEIDAPGDDCPTASGEAGTSTNWGEYEPAIRRWERALGRPAPRPAEPTGRNGGHRLSPRFTEWMMGLDDGWVTAPEIGLTRNEQLKACGNGVVPQQAIAALRDMASYNEKGG